MHEENQPLIYDRAKVINCSFADGVIIGEDSYVKDCKFGRNVHINRRNFLQNVKFGDYTYTGHNATIKYAEIGKFSSISWDVSIGGAEHDYEHLTTHPFPVLAGFGFAVGGGIVHTTCL